MSCAGVRRLFGAYWDDEITLAERDWLEAHFAGCAACRVEYERFARALELVASLPRVEVKPDFPERVLARARRAAATPDRLPLGAPRWIPVTATAALLAIAAATVLQWMGIAPGLRSPRAPESPAVAQPTLVAPVGVMGEAATARPHAVGSGTSLSAATDSLLEESPEIEFVLDPVMLRKGRAHPVLRLHPHVQGDKAVITF